MSNWQDYIGERRGLCPKHLLDKKVQVRLRNGYECPPRTAQLFTWENDGMQSNVVAYRIVGNK